VDDDKKADYRLPPGCRDVAVDPPALVSPYEGRQLVLSDDANLMPRVRVEQSPSGGLRLVKGFCDPDGDWLDLMEGRIFGAAAKKTITALKRYCGQDTMAMVELLKHLSGMR